MSQSRYPAIPLAVHDPFFSIWSMTDRLTDDWTRHWTGAGNVLVGMIRIDGAAFRLMGAVADVPAAEQLECVVHPTRTCYRFEAGGVQIALTFLSPLLPDDLALLARPVSYITCEVIPVDGREHRVQFYFEANNDTCVQDGFQPTVWGRLQSANATVMYMGCAEQRPLNRAGDNHRIDWGRYILACDTAFAPASAIRSNPVLRDSFVRTGVLPDADDMEMPETPARKWHAMGLALDFGAVAPGRPGSRYVLLAYDDIYGIEFLDRKLRGYWRKDGMGLNELLRRSIAEYPEIQRRSAAFDAQFEADCRQAGGEFYAELNALAYRQAVGAHKLVADIDGTPLFFSKENFSNGCIATVDVTYPSAPLFLAVQPELLKGMLTPILQYAALPRWRFNFAPHDLGTYPLANGQVYGGGEQDETNQMPVEECGNMLILLSALVLLHGERDYLARHLTTATRWAEYLLDKGYDPENQLCTDDFAGHLAHNTNLSIKALMALELFGRATAELGENDLSGRCRTFAREAAQRWCRDAAEDDHYRLAFDRPGSWSMKYNLIWNRLFNLGLFPAEVGVRETAFYRTHQNRYGLPLDNRADYTKIDWLVWCAVLSGAPEDFDALLAPVQNWLAETPDRVPLSDWYDTRTGQHFFFRARSVVGGLAVALLFHPDILERYRVRNAPAR